MKTLENKKNWLGMLVLVLVFGMMLAGCTTDFWDGFAEGYNAATGYSYNSGYNPPEQNLMPNFKFYENRVGNR